MSAKGVSLEEQVELLLLLVVVAVVVVGVVVVLEAAALPLESMAARVAAERA